LEMYKGAVDHFSGQAGDIWDQWDVFIVHKGLSKAVQIHVLLLLDWI